MPDKKVRGRAPTAKPKKTVTADPRLSEPSDRYLVWRFGRLDFDGEFACLGLLGADAPELERELVAFQTEPIYKLRRKNWLKFIPSADMTRAGRERLESVSSQEDGLWQLHLLRYKWRVWGFFEDPEFYFLWWDSEHAVATGRSRNRRA